VRVLFSAARTDRPGPFGSGTAVGRLVWVGASVGPVVARGLTAVVVLDG
jgi:hypothetical protein